MPKSCDEDDKRLSVIIPETFTASNKCHSAPITPKGHSESLAMDLNILLKFIKPYDGSRETLNSFIINCNNAYDLASESQKPVLFKYILCQLQGKAEVACSIKEFSTWEQLKGFLKTQFCERKHYAHLLTDLQESKQGPQETVNQFSLKVETCLSQLLTEISLSNTKLKELPGRTAAMEDLALHHFLIGLHPRLSNMVRCRSPKNLNEAINLAISEERIQQSLYKRPQIDNKFSTKSKPQGQVPKQHNQSSYSNASSNFNRNSGLFCRYCKAIGHEIKDCRKREYNNNRFRQTDQPQPSSSGYRPQQRQIHFVSDKDEEDDPCDSEGHDEVDSEPKNE